MIFDLSQRERREEGCVVKDRTNRAPLYNRDGENQSLSIDRSIGMRRGALALLTIKFIAEWDFRGRRMAESLSNGEACLGGCSMKAFAGRSGCA